MKSFKEFSQDEQLVEQYNTEAQIFSNDCKIQNIQRIKHKIQRGAKLIRRKIISDPKKLMRRAIKQQRENCKEITERCFITAVSIARKIEIGKKLDKMKGRIYKLARRLLPQIKKDEKNKFRDKVV